MQYAMQVFEYEDNEQFRVIDRNGEPWFILTEVCKKLDIANPRDAASRLDDDEKDGVGISDAIGRTQRTTVINESGGNFNDQTLFSLLPFVKKLSPAK